MGRRTPAGRSINVTLRTTRRGAEALRLEIRRLTERLGLPPASVRIRRVVDRRRRGT